MIITKFLIVKYECFTKQIGDGNKAHDYTRGIYSVIDTINSILGPSGGLFISSPFEGELNRDGERGRGILFNLETMMVSVLHKRTRKARKAQVKKF